MVPHCHGSAREERGDGGSGEVCMICAEQRTRPLQPERLMLSTISNSSSLGLRIMVLQQSPVEQQQTHSGVDHRVHVGKV